MNGRALVVAAHGSAEPAVNEVIASLAERAGRRLGFDEAIAAFHRGEPGFSRALDTLRSDQVVVVPLLQSEGWYCHRVLPTELAKNRRFAALSVRQTRAVGVHPALGGLLAARVRELAAAYALERPAVALVAHGTPRHRGSREAAEASAADVERAAGFPSRAFFLDEKPPVEAIPDFAPDHDLIVVPLLIGAGRHATHDLARRLGVAVGVECDASAQVSLAHGRGLVIDRPFGLDPAIEEIVVDLARDGQRQAGNAISVSLPSGDW
jgi:sirohydrochlorin ferrochelatase